MISGLSGRLAALFSAVAVLAVVVVGWLLLVSPQRGKAAELDGQIDQTQAQIGSTQAYVSNPATRRNIHDLARLRKVLPDDSRMAQILRQLSTAAGAAHVSVTSITPGAVVPASGGQALPIGLAIEGHYFGISKFLHILRTQAIVRGAAIRGSGRLYSIDGIQFANSGSTAGSSSTSASGGDSKIGATVSLNAFVFGSGAAIVPPTDLSASGETTGTTTTSSSSSAATTAPSP